ncbi:hypothetical protein [Symbiopectobacterium purcellii]|uniref:hypothetical protein n=2 Tax=Symbiopectobacterium purcellii TaxID=2871826 RepID=UPI003F8602FA
MMQAQKKKPNSARTLFRLRNANNSLISGGIMARNRRNFKQKGACRPHPEPQTLMPEDAAKKFAELFRLQQQLYLAQHESEEKRK